MKKQAEGAAAGYKSLLAENESYKKQTDKLHGAAGGEEGDDKKKKVDRTGQIGARERADLEERSSAFMKLMDVKNESDKQLETVKSQEVELKYQRQQIAKLTEERDSFSEVPDSGL
ncbi:unnamed protein product [Peronospora belbahrii]|uniref:Uncharacterized protein n=1 Tax=Peronospora belbahrii TaxID=622444 RepID=A0ABN8CNX3_9STRA|nr:unnamed protein product [Peronospora belbahrii]